MNKYICLLAFFVSLVAFACHNEADKFRSVSERLDSLQMSFALTQDTSIVPEMIELIDSMLQTNDYSESLLKEKGRYLWVLGKFDEFFILAENLLSYKADSLDYFVAKAGNNWLKNDSDSLFFYASKALEIIDKRKKVTSEENILISLLHEERNIYILLDEKEKAKSATTDIASLETESLPLMDSFESDYSAERTFLVQEQNRYLQYLNSNK